MCRTAFFPPRLHPVLDGGPGGKNAMVAPEMPTGRLIGQAVLDDKTDRHSHDTMGVMSLGCGQIGHVGIEVFAATAALVLRVGEMDFAWPTVDEVAEIVQLAGE